MTLLVLIVLACIAQESASTNAVLLSAYQANFPLWVIHLIYVLGTMFDILVAYALGRVVYRWYPESKIIVWVQTAAARIQESIGRRGEIVGMFLFGVVNFVYLDAFVFAWLPFPFWQVFLLLFLGDLVAYAAEWAFVLGVHFIFPSKFAGLAAILAVTVVGALVWHYMHRKSRSTKNHEPPMDQNSEQ